MDAHWTSDDDQAVDAHALEFACSTPKSAAKKKVVVKEVKKEDERPGQKMTKHEKYSSDEDYTPRAFSYEEKVLDQKKRSIHHMHIRIMSPAKKK